MYTYLVKTFQGWVDSGTIAVAWRRKKRNKSQLDKEHVNFGRHEIEVATRPAVGMAFELVPLFWRTD
jgi:hypothetical protein